MADDRISQLEEKLAKRRNQAGMAENVKQIEDELAQLRAEQNGSSVVKLVPDG